MTDLEKLLADATRGPWTAREIKGHTFSQVSGEIPICDVEGLRLAEVGGYGHDAKTRMVRLGEESANARLIALAPQLAAALLVAERALNMIDAIDPEDHVYGCSDDALRGFVIRMGQTARAALAEIAKLTGG